MPIETVLAIYDLYGRYAHAIDERRYEDWADCFTTDAVFEQPGFAPFVGRAALIQMVVDFADFIGDGAQRHIQSNIVLDVRAETATGKCNLTHYLTKGGATTLTGVGAYADELRRVDGRWLFTHRAAHLDHQLQSPP